MTSRPLGVLWSDPAHSIDVPVSEAQKDVCIVVRLRPVDEGRDAGAGRRGYKPFSNTFLSFRCPEGTTKGLIYTERPVNWETTSTNARRRGRSR